MIDSESPTLGAVHFGRLSCSTLIALSPIRTTSIEAHCRIRWMTHMTTIVSLTTTAAWSGRGRSHLVPLIDLAATPRYFSRASSVSVYPTNRKSADRGLPASTRVLLHKSSQGDATPAAQDMERGARVSMLPNRPPCAACALSLVPPANEPRRR
ncbi:hypothetical protein BD413DRAFT_283551 [Trametes elegans]|nr:hypothetical protein BD413DRAFT_283551 [Trametes elegans]